MPLTIPVAHDFICPWCWAGLLQAQQLQREFGVEIDWLGYELFPEELEWPDYPAGAPVPENKPPVLSRFDFLLAADGIKLPESTRPHKMRTFNAHEAVEYAKTLGVADALVDRLYRAYWEQGLEINNLDVLKVLCAGLIPDLGDLQAAIQEKRFKHNLVGFDDEAYSKGVYNVPTFFINGKRLAEQPYSVIQAAVQEVAPKRVTVYDKLTFPSATANRPYAFVDMVATIDGKILSGERNEHVLDLGSANDHELMKRIASHADAVIVGANTLRTTLSSWNPGTKIRVVVSKSGELPFDSAFFKGGDAYWAAAAAHRPVPHQNVKPLIAGDFEVDFPKLMGILKEMGVERLLVLGGSELNAQLLHADLIDELFLTVAPKVKLGRDVPTYADGEPLSRESMHRYALLENHVIGDEVFLRYRRKTEE
jgi:riboflavin biosynthesis pyrimidine reductase/predicted DsbA family dithiol-disulfide isomerase